MIELHNINQFNHMQNSGVAKVLRGEQNWVGNWNEQKKKGP